MNRATMLVVSIGLFWQSLASAQSPEAYFEVNEQNLKCEGVFLNWNIGTASLETEKNHAYVFEAFRFQGECESFKSNLINAYQPGARFYYKVSQSRHWRCVPRTSDCGYWEAEHLQIDISGRSFIHSAGSWAGSDHLDEASRTSLPSNLLPAKTRGFSGVRCGPPNRHTGDVTCCRYENIRPLDCWIR